MSRRASGAAPIAGKGGQGTVPLRRDLSAVDFTLLVIGGMVGDGIYIVTSFGAAHLGPAQLVAWAFAGLLAALIGLAFMQCSVIQPEVGGAYAYARAAFGPTIGFIAGWALYLGEMASMPVFPIAFTRYLGRFIDVSFGPVALAARAALIGVIVGVNVLGVRRSGRLNDVLTIAKLVPLGVLVVAMVVLVATHPSSANDHLSPFAPLGWGQFGEAVLLIFWAYAGFELSVLPAGEVRDPKTTLPRGLLVGIAAVTLIYLLTALGVVVAIPSSIAAASDRPLADALAALLSGIGLPSAWGAGFMSLGALLAIVGVYDVYMLGVARLSYALAEGGAFPPAFARLQRRYGTPWVGLAFQAAVALIGATFFNLSSVLDVTVVFLGIAYLITALAALKLVGRHPESRLHIRGLRPLLLVAALAGGYLVAQATPALAGGGLALLLAGTLVYHLRRHAWQPDSNR